MHFWCSLMQFWNYILLMHFWCSFKGFWCTFDVVSKLNCIKTASKVHHVFEDFKQNLGKIVEMSKNSDAHLMQFWNYIILVHFWCSFKGFWCTFDVVSKLHQNCFKSASCFLRIFSIFLEKCRNVKNIWCTFDVVSKTTSKVHHVFWAFSAKFWGEFCQNFTSISSSTSFLTSHM